MNETPQPRRTATTPRLEEPTRAWILQRLRQIVEIALEHVTGQNTPAADRIKWSRVLVTAGQACNSVLRDAEIEELKKQMKELKQLTEERLGDEDDEQERDQE